MWRKLWAIRCVERGVWGACPPGMKLTPSYVGQRVSNQRTRDHHCYFIWRQTTDTALHGRSNVRESSSNGMWWTSQNISEHLGNFFSVISHVNNLIILNKIRSAKRKKWNVQYFRICAFFPYHYFLAWFCLPKIAFWELFAVLRETLV